MSDFRRLMDDPDTAAEWRFLCGSMGALAAAVTTEIERYHQMQIEANRRTAAGVPDWYAGPTDDWLFIQSMLNGPPLKGALTKFARFVAQPFGARARHRKDLKRKRRKTR